MKALTAGTLLLLLVAVCPGAAGTTRWESWNAADTSMLAKDLWKVGASAKDTRKLLAAHVTSKYLADKAATKSVTPQQWWKLCRALKADLSAETRAAWVEKLRAGWAGDAQALKALDYAQLRQLNGAWIELGDEKTRYAVWAEWAEDASRWNSLKPAQLIWVATYLAMAGDAGKEARDLLIAHVQDKYLADLAATRLVTPQQWSSLLQRLGKDLSAEDCKAWSEKIRAAQASNPEDAVTLRFPEMLALAKATAPADRKAASEMVLGWFSARTDEKLPGLSADQLIFVARLIKPAARTWRTGLIARYDKRWDASFQAGALGLAESLSIGEAWARTHTWDKARPWALRAYQAAFGTEAARAKADADTLYRVGKVVLLSGLVGKGKSYPEYAAVAARLAGQGKLAGKHTKFYRISAAPLCTPETRTTVLAQLLGPDKRLRPEVAHLLVWAHWYTGEGKVWRKYLDDTMAAGSFQGEHLVLWLLARAQVEGLVTGHPRPLLGKKWLEEAFALTTSRARKLEIAALLARAYAQGGKHDRALAYIDQVVLTLDRVEELAALGKLRAEIDRGKVQYLTEQRASYVRRAERFEARAARIRRDKQTRDLFLKWARIFRSRIQVLSEQLENMNEN